MPTATGPQRLADEATSLRVQLEARNAELQDANEHLVMAAMQAEDRRQRMEEFLAMLAHELRNPLAPISTAAAILERSECDPAKVKWVQIVLRRQVVHLTRLLDDLLDASRVTRGKIVLKRTPMRLGTVIDAAVDETRLMVGKREQELVVALADGDVTIDGDAVRLTQVVCNLLHNASKFTPAHGTLRITTDVGPHAVTIHVTDNGDGISAEALPHIFDLFTQGDASLSRTTGGLGIGLTVVRSIVELHGGSVSVRSDGPGRGSDFAVILPLAPRGTAASVSSPEPRRHVAGRRIVVIDDNVDAASAMAILLELAGHEIEVAHDGLAGLDLVVRARPEVVICDIGLPGIDGYEVARRVRAEMSDPPTLIALSGYGQREDRERSLDAGFVEHLVKPADPDVVLGCIERVAGKQGRNRP